MRAVTTIGDHRVATLDHPLPEPGEGEVRVRVHGAGLNRADLLQRAGLYPPPPGSPADIPGLEFSGVIDAVGPGVRGREVGDAVFGIAGGGGQAEALVVPAEHCAPVPNPLADGDALVTMGGVPEAFVTAHDAMIIRARARPGEWILVHAVGSGVGTAALQLAKALGCKVAGTARGADKLDRCMALGLDAAIVPPHTAEGTLDVAAFAEAIRDATDGGAHVTLDLVGGDYVTAEVLAAAPRGRIVFIGTLAGGHATLPVLTVMQRRLDLHGTVLRTRDRVEKAAATAAFVRDVVPHFADRTIVPVIDRVVALADADSAYELLASDATFGKVVLDCR